MAARPYAFCMGFNTRLKDARLAAGLTGDKLGEAVGCSKQNISHWEAGRFEPNLTFVAKLCEVLDVPADWLLLGKLPTDLSAAALRQARLYEKMSPAAQRKFETLRVLAMDGVQDKAVEEKMPITKAPAFKYPKQVKDAPLVKGAKAPDDAKKEND